MKLYTCKTVGSTLLVAGTSIGAGMLALPLTTGMAGFPLAALLFVGVFIFMLMSLFLLLEATLYSHHVSANLITLAKEQLGPLGQGVAWIAFLLLLYSVAAAYISAGGALIATLLSQGLETPVMAGWGMVLFVLLFGCFTIFGTRGVDAINRLFVFGLFATFALLIVFTFQRVEGENMGGGDAGTLWAAIPVAILSFTSHIIVPSLRTYLTGNIPKLKKALFWGSVIPLVFYLVWEFIILGILPIHGEFSLEKIAESPHPVAAMTLALNVLLKFPLLSAIVGLFSFCALVTSFFGVTLALADFLADGLQIKKVFWGRIFLLVISFLPPLLFALFYPKGFLLALGYAGVFVAILYGILPAVMVWKGRYITDVKSPYRMGGGKVAVVVVFLGSLFVIALQIAVTNGFLSHGA